MNAPTVEPEIQQAAARSLLERLGEKTALVRFFRYNASAKHGVPIDPLSTGSYSSTRESTTTVNRPDGSQEPQPQTQTPTPREPQTTTTTTTTPASPANISVNLTQPNPPQTQAVQPNNSNDFMKGVLIALASVAGIGGAGWIGYNMASNKEPTTTVQAPATEKPVEPLKTGPIEQKPAQSPLQFLEDKGQHLP